MEYPAPGLYLHLDLSVRAADDNLVAIGPPASTTGSKPQRVPLAAGRGAGRELPWGDVRPRRGATR
jgi:hypothetical protein